MSGSDAQVPSAVSARGGVQQALRLVCVALPHLAGLAYLVRIEVDNRLGTTGIFPSGRLLVNPDWFTTLNRADATFVVAHELLHLALHTHERAVGSDPHLFNCAHDYLINDMLVEALGRPVPASGLTWPGARHLTAESIVRQLRQEGATGQDALRPSWGSAPGAAETAMTAALRASGLLKAPPVAAAGSDVLDSALERQWFPDTDVAAQVRAQAAVQRAAAQAVSLDQLREATERLLAGAEVAEGPATELQRALRTLYRPPWELALQQWLEDVTLGPRSYLRPSRRGADRTDVVLAGRRREGWTLHVVLDTSGSMHRELSHALGAIATFCEGANVSQLHLLQCDDDLTRDDWVAPEELDAYEITGFGGSDLTPAMVRLAADPEVEAALVITDGAIDYPAEPMPYAVLWVLTSANDYFEPDYGRVIELPGRSEDA